MNADEDIKLDRRDMLLTTAGIAALTFTSALGAVARQPDSLSYRRAHPFDEGWRFYRGSGDGLEAAGYDDRHWRELDLPHDWRIEDLPVISNDSDRIRGPF